VKINLRGLAKFGFLLVIFGFFMPISCNMNGFELASINFLSGLLLYIMFFSAIFGVFIGILLINNLKEQETDSKYIIMLKKKLSVNKNLDWLITILCIGSGLIGYIVLFMSIGNWGIVFKLNSGAYVILLGWVIIPIFQSINLDTNSNHLINIISHSDENSNKHFCTQCGNKIEEGNKFCSKCGKKI
jgi:hypothetical protein